MRFALVPGLAARLSSRVFGGAPPSIQHRVLPFCCLKGWLKTVVRLALQILQFCAPKEVLSLFFHQGLKAQSGRQQHDGFVPAPSRQQRRARPPRSRDRRKVRHCAHPDVKRTQSKSGHCPSGGIGSACARALAAEGCDVALHYSSSKARIIPAPPPPPPVSVPLAGWQRNATDTHDTGQGRVAGTRLAAAPPHAALRHCFGRPHVQRVHASPRGNGPGKAGRRRETQGDFCAGRQRRPRTSHPRCQGYRGAGLGRDDGGQYPESVCRDQSVRGGHARPGMGEGHSRRQHRQSRQRLEWLPLCGIQGRVEVSESGLESPPLPHPLWISPREKRTISAPSWRPLTSCSSMGLNLATLLAPEGVTVNIVSAAASGSLIASACSRLCRWRQP